MKRRNKYIEVDTLPDGAITVREYAESLGITPQALYNQIRKGKDSGFRIVVWKGYNWVAKER